MHNKSKAERVVYEVIVSSFELEVSKMRILTRSHTFPLATAFTLLVSEAVPHLRSGVRAGQSGETGHATEEVPLQGAHQRAEEESSGPYCKRLHEAYLRRWHPGRQSHLRFDGPVHVYCTVQSTSVLSFDGTSDVTGELLCLNVCTCQCF